MSAIPLVYNLESVRARWTSAIVAVAGIAGTVGVFIAMLALAHGFEASLVTSGLADNAMIRRSGATSEMDSALTLGDLRVVEVAPGVARKGGTALVSPEVVVVAAIPLRATGTDANVQIRGLSPLALDVHRNVRIAAGRMFNAGLAEVVVGRNALAQYSGLDLGGRVRFGGMDWAVVGVMDAGGSSFDSEVWSSYDMLNQAYQRPTSTYQSMTARLDRAEDLASFRQLLASDPRVNVQVDSEIEYYRKESRLLTALITTLGMLVAIVMGVGAVLGALNTMYSAVAERSREIATLRAVGFGAAAVVASFVVEALIIAFAGGIVGCLAALPINGVTTGAMNFQTFSHMAFAFRVTPALLGAGIVFALLMGVVGGVPPAVRAARLPIASALRDL